MSAATLVVGYGNALRGDDGIGWHAAALLAGDPRLSGAQVIQLHQLTPELALDFSRARLVVLIDASSDLPAGTHKIARVERGASPGAAWSHHLSPASLAELAHELYGRSPEVYLVSVGAASFELGDPLSAPAREALPRVADVVAHLVASILSDVAPAEASHA